MHAPLRTQQPHATKAELRTASPTTQLSVPHTHTHTSAPYSSPAAGTTHLAVQPHRQLYICSCLQDKGYINSGPARNAGATPCIKIALVCSALKAAVNQRDVRSQRSKQGSSSSPMRTTTGCAVEASMQLALSWLMTQKPTWPRVHRLTPKQTTSCTPNY